MTRSRLAPNPLFLSLALNIPGCTIDRGIGDMPGDSETSVATEPGSATNPTEGASTLCPGNPLFSCTVPFNCVDFPCGGLQDRFDGDGCPRLDCSADKPCAEGQVCYQTGDWGECDASSVGCEDASNLCRCGQSLDCEDVAYCVPAELGPPADCFAITDAQACVAAGCDDAPTVIPVTLADDDCICGAPQVACLWFKGVKLGTPAPTPFYRKSTLEVVMLPDDWLEVPHGWERCGVAGAPAACSCAFICSF